METYPRAAVERAMKIQEVIMRAMAKKITWAQAGEILGRNERQMRRWRRTVANNSGTLYFQQFGAQEFGHRSQIGSYLAQFAHSRRYDN
jgi:hypothetical protein